MNSILKILTDYPCQVFCDFKLIGDAFPNSIFKVELRKGIYIFEFKDKNRTLLTQDSIICSNDEEQLLRISLIPIVTKINREERYNEIANRLVEIKWNSSCLEDKQSERIIPIKYNITEGSFDKCGLLSVNIGGEFKSDYGGWSRWYEGGKFGCINKNGDVQIPFIYDNPVFFRNKKVAIGRIAREVHFINKWGEEVFENRYEKVSYYTGDLCVVGMKDKYGLMNSSGDEIIPLIYDKILIIEKNENIYAYLTLNGRIGLCDSEGAIIIPIKYDAVNLLPSGNISVCYESKYGVIDLDGNMIIPIEYEILNNSCNRPIVRRNGKYGVIASDAGKTPDVDDFKELVPIIYDAVYTQYGKERPDKEMYGIAGGCTYFVKNENELLHCVQFEEKEIKQYMKTRNLNTGEEVKMAIKSIYNAGIKDEFICKSFCKTHQNILIFDDRYYFGQYFKDIETDQGYDHLDTILNDESFRYEYYLAKNQNCWSIIENAPPYKCILTDIDSDRVSCGEIEGGNYIIISKGNSSTLLYLIKSGRIDLKGQYENVVHTAFRDNKKNYQKGFFSLQLNKKWAIATDDFSYISPFIYDDSAIGKCHLDNEKIKNIIYEKILNFFFQYKTYGEKKILFIDTETTGLPLSSKAAYTDLNNWPHLVQVSIKFVCGDGDFNEQFSYDSSYLSDLDIIIAPDNYIIPNESTRIHGISHNYAIKYGINRTDILSYLDELLYNVDIIIGHNIDFDLNVLKCEILRVKGKNNLFSTKTHRVLDTMKLGAELCKIPMQYGTEYKWPTLDELHRKLFQKEITRRHNAMSDVEATYECFIELWMQGCIK